MYTNSIKPKLWILIGIPIIFLFGSLMHFAYDLSGHSTIVGIFTPVNESIWEHLKLSVYPTFLWWIIGFFILDDVPTYRWFRCCVFSVIVSPIVITSFYYTYTGALGIHSLFLDIFSLFLGLLISQCFALHLYNRAKIEKFDFYLSILISLLIVITFTIFTFSPPKLPIFMDPITQQYGI
ncbi:DUF6512 family protein [Clostridium gelidum]|uniref:DUF6512 family protein n=1 Tax=Clostridium gelidum TaxID=704125 RepID=UPI001CC7BD60|nr:DUF6512 family protein [Clostridium gelidum]